MEVISLPTDSKGHAFTLANHASNVFVQIGLPACCNGRATLFGRVNHMISQACECRCHVGALRFRIQLLKAEIHSYGKVH